jgi:hypothetical protein
MKLTKSQMIGVCWGSWAVWGHLLSEPVRGIAASVLLSVMFLLVVMTPGEIK